MKKTKSTAFTKARIEMVDGEFLIIEPGKKDAPDKVYSLTAELKEWCEIEGVSLVIKKDEDVAPEDVVEEINDEFIED